MLSTVESGIRQEQFLPELQREGSRRILEEFVPHYQEIADKELVRLGYSAQGSHVELNPSFEIRPDAKIIHLYSGIHRLDRLSLDFILLWGRILRPPQFINRYPQAGQSRSTDLPTIHKLLSGRMGVYSGKDSKREEILHDGTNGYERWDYTVVSGRISYEIRTWERPAFVLSIVPDTAYVTSEQIKLPL
ncbi:MAG: hypothetical protein HYT08_02430 [Candidatus Levybacteria bacterium]|nr:hypothetical protein [Candidatus Levybacteria bacterium]